jgi:hypothetical protein
MITIAHSFTRVVIGAALLATALLTMPGPAAAQGDESPRGVWMAGSGPQASGGANWGRLMLRNGVLTFHAATTEWQLAVADIKRAAIGPSDQLVLESVTGEAYSLTILDARMMADSPRDALKIIQRALRVPAARRE